MLLKRRKATYLKWLGGMLLFLLLLGFAGSIWADNSQAATVSAVNANNASWWQKAVNSMTGNMLYAMVAYMEMGLYILWLLVTWAVVKLYSGIGTYLIPIWDFSNGTSFFNFSIVSEQSAWGVSAVPPVASQLLWSMVPWLLAFCGILMFGLGALSIPKNLFTNRDPLSGMGGLVWAAGLLVAYPLIYSVPINIGNILGRQFYNTSQANYAQLTSTQQGAVPTGLFDSLVASSLFPGDNLGGSSNATPAQLVAAGVGTAVGVSTTSTISSTSQLSTAFTSLSSDMDPNGGGIASAWDIAKNNMMVNIELQASRCIQIILGIMAMIGLVGLLILKGTQIVAMILNFYLGWIACALFVHPATRGIFYSWLKAHITLCLWGLIWALIIFVMYIVAAASSGMHGMAQQLGALPGVFANVGIFLMPFMLFGAIHMLKNVKDLANTLAVTSDVAHQAHVAVVGALKTGMDPQTGVTKHLGDAKGHVAGKGSLGAKAGNLASSAFQSGMGKITAGASKAAMAIPGVGMAVAGGIQMAGMAAKAAGRHGIRAGAQAVHSSHGYFGFHGGSPGKADPSRVQEPAGNSGPPPSALALAAAASKASGGHNRAGG